VIRYAPVDTVSAIPCIVSASVRIDASVLQALGVTRHPLKPIGLVLLLHTLMLESTGTVKDSYDSKQAFQIDSSGLPAEEILFGKTKAMLEVSTTIGRTCDTDLPVLIRGETGTGKELIARYVHCRSRLRDAPFVKVNCAAIPVHLLESELLGYEKGAFTGATESKPGLVEMANGGTLFLDEIGDMDASLQTKLLHLLQDGRYSRIGAEDDRHAKVRIICATNCDLEQAVSEGKFRSDLFYRIDVICLRLSPLRERREDIPALAQHLINKLNKRYSLRAAPLSEITVHLISHWQWPGNIREFESWIMRAMVLGVHDALGPELHRQILAIGRSNEGHTDGVRMKEASKELAWAAERALILKHLEANQWNRRKTARELNICYRSLLYKLQRVGVPSLRRVRSRNPLTSPNTRED
jgi:two-component system, NtrC family, response regulator AtoC